MVLKRPGISRPGLCVRYWSRVNSLRPFACLLGAAIAMATTLCVAQTAAQPSAQAAPAPGRPASKLPGSQPRPAIELPDIGSPVDAVISRDDEYKLGLQVVRGLREQGQILDDPEVNDYMQSLGARIAAQTPDGQRQFQYFVVRDAAINAFALPGGFVGVNSGLVLASANEAQLAGVLAHETAHVTQRHIARSIRAQGRQGLMTAGALLAAILLGAAAGGSGDIAQGAIAIAQGSAAQAQINFTRDNEYEADRVGMGFLAAAGFDPAEPQRSRRQIHAHPETVGIPPGLPRQARESRQRLRLQPVRQGRRHANAVSALSQGRLRNPDRAEGHATPSADTD